MALPQSFDSESMWCYHMSPRMDEKEYEKLAFETLRRVVDLFDDVDVDEADVESTGDVVRIQYADGSHCVVNTQRPVRQLWLAGLGRGWHFDFDATNKQWVDDKGSGRELFEVLREVSSQAGVSI